MADIQRYSQKVSLSGESPKVQASPEAYSASGRAISTIGEAISTVNDQLVKAQEFAQKTTAINQAKMSISEIQARAAADPDPNNIDSYLKEIHDVHKTAGQGITLRNASDAFKLEFQSEANNAHIELAKMKRSKIVDQGVAGIHQGLTQFNSDFINATPDKEDIILAQTESLIHDGYAHGFITAKEAVDIKDKHFSQVGLDKANNALTNAQTVAEATAVRDAILNGRFEEHKNPDGSVSLKGVTMDEAKKRHLLDNAESKIKQIENKGKYSERMERADLVHDLTDQANNGILKGQTLEEAFLQKGISNSTYNSLSANIVGKVGPTAGTDHQTYYDLTHYLISGEAEPEEAIRRILDANSAGKLSRDDQKKLFEMHLMPSPNGDISIEDAINQKPRDQFDAIKKKYDDRTAAINANRKWFTPAFRSFDEYFSGPNKTADVVDATKQLVDNVKTKGLKNEEIPAEADLIVGQKLLQKHPEYAKFPKTGQPMHDRFGNKVTVFPDGRVVRRK